MKYFRAPYSRQIVQSILLLSKAILLVAMVLSLAACKKAGHDVEDDKPEEETPLNPGDGGTVVTTFELVEVKPDPAYPFDRDLYQGVFDGIAIELVKNENGSLFFMVPYEVAEGTKTLRITGFDDKTWTFTVQPSPFKEAATPEVFAEVLDKIKAQNPLGDDPESDRDLQQVFDQLDRVIASTSPEEKRRISLYYLHYQRIIDELLFADFDVLTEQYATTNRSIPLYTAGLMASANRQSNTMSSSLNDKETAALITKFSISILLVGGGAVLVYGGPTIEKALGVAVIIVGITKAKKYKRQLDTHQIKVVGFAYDKIVEGFKGHVPRSVPAVDPANIHKAASSRTSSYSDPVELEFERDTALNIQLARRSLILQDREDTDPLVKSFFTVFGQLETIIETINDAIDWINKRVPFVSYDKLPEETLAEEVEEIYEPLSPEIQQDMTIRFNGMAELASHRWDEEGRLVLHIKPKPFQYTEDIKANLTLTYYNQYHHIEQEFEIKIDACATVQRLLNGGATPKELHDRWYESSCFIGKAYGGGMIGFSDISSNTLNFCIVLANQPIGSGDFGTAVAAATGFRGGGYTDWRLYGPNESYLIAYSNLLAYYQENGTPVSTTGYIWINHPWNNGNEHNEADAQAYRLSFGVVPQKISAQHTIWPMRVVTF